MKNFYEAIYILKPNLSKEQLDAQINHLKELVTNEKGEIKEASFWQEKRKLAYPIKKFQEGVYYLIQFDADPSLIAKLRKSYRLNENILRYLIIKKENSAKKIDSIKE
ncbi:MAG: 30S ribosomal protein S6 [Candidatus Gygaella obscura]|nr:30S ribosomal protein S6 [Candidatus Gygaella obscura]